jgi:hypothetical protein
MVADEQSPRDRTAGRVLRLELLGRLKRLRRLGLAFPLGRNWVSDTKPDPAMQRPAGRQRRRRAARSRSVRAVSAGKSPSLPEQPVLDYLVKPHLSAMYSAISHAVEKPEKIESVLAPEQVSAAARALAKLPRNQARKLTGLLHGRRSWRGQRILLPGGRPAFVWGCMRGKVVWSLDPEVLLFGVSTARVEWGVLAESQVTLEKSAAAALLGGLKRGVRERPSALKAISARRNGAMPVRPGSRPRGRPSKHSQSSALTSGLDGTWRAVRRA